MKNSFGYAKAGVLRGMIAWCIMSTGAATLWANTPTVEYRWSGQAVPEGATLIQENGESVLRVENNTGTSVTVHLATISDPELSPSKPYQIKGTVKYEGVKGKAYLETWNYIPRANTKQVDRFFSRTVGSTGDMAALSGDSDWRSFTLPFFPDDTAPTRIDFNLVLPGGGTVYLREFELKESVFGAGNRGGMWGLAGAALGIFCALCSTLAGRAIARSFVMPAITGVIVVNIALLAYGLYLFIGRQPFFEWYPPTLLGGLGVLLLPMLLMRSRTLYEQVELRRISAQDTAAE